MRLWYLDIIYIAIIVVCITDIALFFDHFQEWLGKKLGGTVNCKLLSCSFCQNWWLCLAYLILTNNIHLYTIAFTLFISVQTPIIADAIYLIRDSMGNLINKLTKLLC